MRLNIIRNERPYLKRKPWTIPNFENNQDFNRIEDLDVIDAAKNGFHIVTIGFLGLTFISHICEYGFGIKYHEQIKLLKLIQDNNETGTLFPKAKLTILPFLNKNNINLNFLDIYEVIRLIKEDIQKNIYDALNAESKYIKSGKVIFDFRGLGDEMHTYNSILRNIILNEFKEIEGNIYYYSYNNEEFITEKEYWGYSIFNNYTDARYYELLKEKAEKQKRKDIKRQLKESKVIERDIKIEPTRNHIQTIRNLPFQERLIIIAKSERVIYFYSEVIDEILNDYNLKEHHVLIKIIISKFKVDEVGKFKKLKTKLELAIQS